MKKAASSPPSAESGPRCDAGLARRVDPAHHGSSTAAERPEPDFVGSGDESVPQSQADFDPSREGAIGPSDAVPTVESGRPRHAAEGPADDQSVRPDAPTDSEPSAEWQRLEHHAEQLAIFLRGRQRNLDQRESELNACASQWEQDVRSIRLELDESRHRLTAWRNELEEKQADVDRRATALAAAEMANEQTHQDLQRTLREREDRLHAREGQCVERESRVERSERLIEVALRKLETARRDLERREQVDVQQSAARRAEIERREWQLLKNVESHLECAERERERQRRETASVPARDPEPVPREASEEDLRAFRMVQEAAERERRVALRDEQLDARQRDVEAGWEALRTERARWAEEEASRSRQAAQRQHDHTESLARERARLESLVARAARLRSLALAAQRDARRIHGESLEIRLAAEQLWNLASDRLDPAMAARRFADLRSRIAAYFVEERRRIAARADELRESAKRLAQRDAALTREREAWVRRTRGATRVTSSETACGRSAAGGSPDRAA
ncbi:MAG: hypothetical protein FJ297_06265 [Planctomycetes bacterium]|nr:hypothetical protein [Planctomycetota bacterium]